MYDKYDRSGISRPESGAFRAAAELSELYGENLMPYAQATVRWQTFRKTFTPEQSLLEGTIFPELVSEYSI